MPGGSDFGQIGPGGANSPTVTGVKVVHAAPKLASINVLLNNIKTTFKSFNYTDYTGYILITRPGVNVFSVFIENNNNPILTKSLEFTNGKSYTVFITDTLPKLNAVSVLDAPITAPGKDSVRLRFANMSSDAGPLDLYIRGKEKPVAENITYGSATIFMNVLKAEEVIFEVKPARQNTVIAVSNKINLLSGEFYTLMTSGYSGTKDAGHIRLSLVKP